MIDSAEDPSSPFHDSHATTSTDARVYLETSENGTPALKKRKRESDAANAIENARYPEHVYANEHVQKAQAIVKKECEDLIRLFVSRKTRLIMVY